MATQVIVLNGGSSSGKTAISRCLQQILPNPWLRISIDDLVDALPPSLLESDAGISFGEQGEVTPGPAFAALESAWLTGIAAMVRAGARIILDDVFLGGGASQTRVRTHLEGLDILWVGVHCHPDTATRREQSRGDRTPGMAASQAEIVHTGVTYHLEVDTTHAEPLQSARTIATHVT